MTSEFGERESDPEFAAFFRRLLGDASRLRLPELFGGPPRDILYHLSNREISVVAVRATSLTHDQRGLTAATPRTLLAERVMANYHGHGPFDRPHEEIPPSGHFGASWNVAPTVAVEVFVQLRTFTPPSDGDR